LLQTKKHRKREKTHRECNVNKNMHTHAHTYNNYDKLQTDTLRTTVKSQLSISYVMRLTF